VQVRPVSARLSAAVPTAPSGIIIKPSLPRSRDGVRIWLRFLIIGGGISGLFLSYYLLTEGHDVVLADSKRGRVRTSAYNAGQLSSRPSFTDVFLPSEAVRVSALEKRRNGRWFRLARKQSRERHEEIAITLSLQSLELYRRFFTKETAAAVDMLGEVLELYTDMAPNLHPPPPPSYPEAAAAQAREGPEGRFLRPTELAERGYKGFEGGWLKEERSLHSAKLLGLLRSRISDLGGRVQEGEATAGGGARLKAPDRGSRISYALVGGERVVADAYVVAGGSWSRAVCRPLHYDPMIIPARGLVLFYRTKGRQVIDYPAHYADEQVTITQHDKHTVRLTGFFELAGFNPRFSRQRMDSLFNTVTSHLSRPYALSLGEVGVGFRPTTPDQLPLVGRIPNCKNGYILAGSCRKGMVLAPVLSRLLIDGCMLDPGGTAPDPVLHALDPGRFS
jgi:glycine/D-amino acid oxidase-like deaminating enzyme